ncbi:uncharacterized protein [Ptychodera flava]|uniref:uncharacterized protein isoform X2 n=1 Tax=Ptychodera flava TaxID=63121 RepID=UPI00396AA81C
MSTKAKSNGAESDDYTMEHRTTMPYLSAAYQDRVRPCIDLVDSLRRIGLDKDVDLPAVVVIGDQSVGKSSVLEAISGVQLPRGTEIVTRCPVELRLKTLDENDWRGRIRYASYSKESVDKYIDHPDNVGAEIREAQNKITNSQRGISDSLITVEIESPYVPNLTLIDLPGIARVALDGQPDNIADKIKTLLKKFIAKEETIILCVIPCNVDIATTEALKMAQEVDPSGSRTLGVLTKPDLVDLGTEPNVVKIAQNKVIPLKKGYTVIKCRGQKNVESKQPLDEAMDEEDRFFKEHRIYNVLYHERCAGTRVLANKLTSELVEQIRKSVPQLQRGIKDKLEETKQELVALGDTVPIDTVERVDLLVRILGRFPEDFQNAADGVYKNATWDRSLRLQSIVKRLYEKFADELEALQPKPMTVTRTRRNLTPKARSSTSTVKKKVQLTKPEPKAAVQNPPKSRAEQTPQKEIGQPKRNTDQFQRKTDDVPRKVDHVRRSAGQLERKIPETSTLTAPPPGKVPSTTTSPSRQAPIQDTRTESERHVHPSASLPPGPVPRLAEKSLGNISQTDSVALPRQVNSRGATLPVAPVSLNKISQSTPSVESKTGRSATLPIPVQKQPLSPSNDWDFMDDDEWGSVKDIPSYTAVKIQKQSPKFFGAFKKKQKTSKSKRNTDLPRRDSPDGREALRKVETNLAPPVGSLRKQSDSLEHVRGRESALIEPKVKSLTDFDSLHDWKVKEQIQKSRNYQDSVSSDSEYYSPTETETEKSPIELEFEKDQFHDAMEKTATIVAAPIQSTAHSRPLELLDEKHLAATPVTADDIDKESVNDESNITTASTSDDVAIISTTPLDDVDGVEGTLGDLQYTEGDNYLPEIKEEIREQRGLELPPFVKDRIICENLIRKIIKEFIPPAERLLQAVNFEVERIGQKLVMDTYQQFPRLQTTVMSKFCDLQQQAVHFTKEAIDIKFKMEDMIQTQDRVYRDVEKMMLQSPPSGASSSSSDPPGGGSSSGNTVDGGDDERPYTYDEESESRKVLRALQVYLKVATNRLMDDIPMTITYYLLQELAKEIKTEMAKLMIEKNFDDFLREDPAIEERRLALENKRERLDRANKELALFTL